MSKTEYKPIAGCDTAAGRLALRVAIESTTAKPVRTLQLTLWGSEGPVVKATGKVSVVATIKGLQRAAQLDDENAKWLLGNARAAEAN